MRARVFAACALVLLVATDGAFAGGKGPRSAEAVWTHPGLAGFDVKSIAFLPLAMYDNSLENRRTVETAVGQALKGTGYRFVSTVLAQEWLARAGGDSLVKALGAQVLHDARIDSASAPACSRAAHARALLCVRVDRMERVQLEYNQSGKPTTTVELHMALVDSTGTLLWSAHGAETMEGQYQEPANGSLGVQASGLSNTLVTGRIGAPSFAEVIIKLLGRWTPLFPLAAARGHRELIPC